MSIRATARDGEQRWLVANIHEQIVTTSRPRHKKQTWRELPMHLVATKGRGGPEDAQDARSAPDWTSDTFGRFLVP